MTKRILFPLSLLCVFALLAGCGPTATPAPSESPIPTAVPSASPTPEPTPTPDPIQLRLDDMTLEEKVAQMFVVGFDGTAAEGDVADYVQSYHMGGVILFGRNVESAEQLVSLTNGIKALNGDYIPLFVGVDQEGGTVERMPPEIKKLPKPYDLGSASPDNYDGAAKLGEALAAECATFGFNLDFAPSFDVWSNPKNTVIGKRSFSSDPSVAAVAAARCGDGLGDNGIIPVPKHFPGHGDTDVDSHIGLPVVSKSFDEWVGSDFPPFWGAIDYGYHTMMVSHILLTCLDDAYPATLSKKIVTDFLRGEQRFEGVLFTDDMTMGAITENYGLGEACVLAVEAGNDVLLVCHKRADVETAYASVLEAVRSGRIRETRMDESVTRILSLKNTYALTNESVPPADVDALNVLVDEVWGEVPVE
ncbi:MAG: beta-N-acetylhexosaminidase [Clostridia bacterium]|nr:beta-N-acetylhexosaminidase [Clostridia bacterium]